MILLQTGIVQQDVVHEPEKAQLECSITFILCLLVRVPYILVYFLFNFQNLVTLVIVF